ncbi:MAG: PaaI family thioesterase [Firmicutes bacterium]|nr:PaaI family thioesterase [Bacillota bacterium]
MGTENCFVCGESNPFGLHIHFFQEGEEAVAIYRCEERHVGWPGIQHGGITAALLDEAAGYVPHFMGLVAMTAKLEATFVEPIRVGDVVRIAGWATSINRRLIEVEAKITGEDGSTKAHAHAKMRVLSERQLDGDMALLRHRPREE